MRTTLSCAIAALFLLASSPAQAGWDIFQSYVIVDLGAGSAYYAGGQNADGSTAFSELDFGTMDPTSDIFTLQGGEIKTWKDGSSNVCGGHVFYRLYATGSTPGSFASVQLDFAENLTGSNQKWNATGANINLLSSLADGGYTLEVMWDVQGGDFGGCSQTKEDSSSPGNGFTASFDVASSCSNPMVYHGYNYNTVQIGDQCWLAENLKTTTFNNGDEIPLRTTNGQWNGNTIPIRRMPGNSTANFDVHGFHYSGWTITDSRNVCPTDWHVPTKSDWMELLVASGAPASDTLNLAYGQTIGTEELTGKKLRALAAGGTDDFGFTALLSGRAHGAGQGTVQFNVEGSWFIDMVDPSGGTMEGGEYLRIEVRTGTDYVKIDRNRRKYGAPVRCMKDQTIGISGCTNSGACNYNDAANLDDESCILPTGCETCSGATDGTGTVIANDDDNDGICNDDENKCVLPSLFEED